MSIENDAWDAVAKERGNYIDKKMLIQWLNEQYKKHKPHMGGYDEFNQGMQAMIDYTEQAIEAGTFDIQEDETHG